MAVSWKKKQALRNCIAKGSLAERASLLTEAQLLVYKRVYTEIGSFGACVSRNDITLTITLHTFMIGPYTVSQDVGAMFAEFYIRPWYTPRDAKPVIYRKLNGTYSLVGTGKRATLTSGWQRAVLEFDPVIDLETGWEIYFGLCWCRATNQRMTMGAAFPIVQPIVGLYRASYSGEGCVPPSSVTSPTNWGTRSWSNCLRYGV